MVVEKKKKKKKKKVVVIVVVMVEKKKKMVEKKKVVHEWEQKQLKLKKLAPLGMGGKVGQRDSLLLVLVVSC